MIQTLTLSSTNTGDYFLSSDGLQLYHRNRDLINLNLYDDCFGCVFYIPSNRQLCFKCEKLSDVECLAQSNFQRVDVYYSFMILYENLESAGLKMYTSLNEIQNTLSEDIQSLFISAYNNALWDVTDSFNIMIGISLSFLIICSRLIPSMSRRLRNRLFL